LAGLDAALLHAVAHHLTEFVLLSALNWIGVVESRLLALFALTVSLGRAISASAASAASAKSATTARTALPSALRLALLLSLLHAIDHLIEAFLLVGGRHGKELVHLPAHVLSELAAIALEELAALIVGETFDLLTELIAEGLAIGFGGGAHLVAELLQLGESRIGAMEVAQGPGGADGDEEDRNHSDNNFFLIHDPFLPSNDRSNFSGSYQFDPSDTKTASAWPSR
jgi:hypothetical protein